MRLSGSASYDAVVVGGGVVGCAVLRELTVHRGWRCLLLEASPHLVSGASSGNTGIACTASDVTPGTLEHQCLTAATRINVSTYRALNVPHRPSGTLYAGYNASEMDALRREHAKRSERGDASARILTASEARAREPGLNASLKGALLIPGETVVDPWLVPIAYARHAHENGATIRRGAEVTAAAYECGQWRLTVGCNRSGAVSAAATSDQRDEDTEVRARVVVACGGLRGDHLERMHRDEGGSPFEIRPRRGDFVLFDEPRATTTAAGASSAAGASCAALGSMPVGGAPSETSRGVYIWRSVHGVLACGPTAEEVGERATPPTPTSESVRRALHAAAAAALPELQHAAVIGTYAGLRPGTDVSTDYHIACAPNNPTWVTVGGIRSTGLTASLGIGRHVADLCETALRASTGALPSPAVAITTPLPPVQALIDSFRQRGDGTVSLSFDGSDAEHGFGPHYVTHPLTRTGFARLSGITM